MRKLSCVVAALATLAVGVPTAASAGGFGVYVGGDRDYNYYGHRYYGGPRFGFYAHDRGLHRGWYHRDYDRGAVIRRYHYWDD